jgi:tRNA threonylcarbamoyladenosine biosynthesis protein TsaB
MPINNPNNLTLLALDASTEACSVALLHQHQISATFELCPQSHSLKLLPMVDQILTQAGIKLAQLDGLVFGQGPGSFTGVRIGIGVAQGLAFAADLPLVGVSTLQTLAQLGYQQSGKQTVVAAIDARMGEVYNGIYQLNAEQLMMPVGAETVLTPEQFISHCQQFGVTEQTPAYTVGTGWDAHAASFMKLSTNPGAIQVLYPQAEAMLALALPKFNANDTVTAEQAQPVYVRDTVSWQKLPGR